MPNNFIQPPANTGVGLKVRTFEVTETSGPASGQAVEEQCVVTTDPTSGTGQAVTTIHTTFNSVIPAGGSALTAGVAQIQNVSGKLDPSLECGQDGIPAGGIPATVTNLAQRSAFTTSAQSLASSTGNVVITVASSTGFVVRGVALIDSGSNFEAQVIVAIPDGTHITVDHLNNGHNGTVTAFPIAMFVYNQERDAAGELDVAPGIGAATAIEYEFDGVTYLRGRNVFGVSGLYTDSVAASSVASALPVTITTAGTPPANIVGAALVIDPLGTPEMQQITAVNPGAKTITVSQMTSAHTGPFRVYAATQALNTVPQNLSGIGVAAEAALLYSGPNAVTGVQQFSVEKDINAVGTVLPISVAIGAAGASGIDADCELGVVDTTARTFANSTLIPDQHGQGGEDLVTVGGRVTQQVTPTSLTVIKATAGRLCRVLLSTANGANAILIYDNASAASGTVIGVVAASAVAGTILDLQMPCAAGITIAATAAAATITLSYY